MSIHLQIVMFRPGKFLCSLSQPSDVGLQYLKHTKKCALIANIHSVIHPTSRNDCMHPIINTRKLHMYVHMIVYKIAVQLYNSYDRSE